MIYINSSGINSGGGRVLFLQLLEALDMTNAFIAIDRRLINEIKSLYPTFKNLIIVRRSFIHRLWVSLLLAKRASSDDMLFCFNSLPPVFRSRARVVTYVHSPQFGNLHRGVPYDFKDRIRFFIERVWFRVWRKNSDLYIVQSYFFRDALSKQFSDINIEVCPFFDLSKINEVSAQTDCRHSSVIPFSLIYPASAAGSKNHRALFAAMHLLSKSAPSPTLYVTLPDEDFKRLTVGLKDLNIINLNVIKHELLIEYIRNCSALIFPSRAETLGLPLAEATILNKPILCANLDYVYSFCDPHDTFNPTSPLSIAKCIAKFFNINFDTKTRIFEPAHFINSFLQFKK